MNFLNRKDYKFDMLIIIIVKKVYILITLAVDENVEK